MSGWKGRTIGILMLTVVAGLPVAATACALVCDTAGAAHQARHGHAGHAQAGTEGHEHQAAVAPSCHESASAPAQPQTGPVPHDCRTHAGTAFEVEPAQTASRVHGAGMIAAQAAAVRPVAAPLHAQATVRSTAAWRPPGSTASAARTPLVLRI